jgi:hypothetical protein
MTDDSIEEAVVICEDITEDVMAEDVIADDVMAEEPPISEAPPIAEDDMSIAEDMPESDAIGMDDEEDCARAPVASRATMAVPAVSRRIM